MNGTLSNTTLGVAFDEKKIDAIFAQLDQCHFPGAAAGIAIGGRQVYRKGFGLASMELPVVLSPTTGMPIGSITKHFTCLAYLLQCEDGKAGIDDTIGNYLPELHPVVHGITMRQVMGHLGGLRDAQDISMAFSGIRQETSAAQVLSLYRDIDDLNAMPGAAFIYNNGGYLILSTVIERISRQPLDEVLHQRIFEPAGMYDTLLRRFDTRFVPGSATPHMMGANGRFEKGFRSVEGVGQGGIVSTIDDMLRWLAHMDAPVIGAAETWKAMKTPQTLVNGRSTGYGLGLGIGQYRGIETISHAGGVIGGNSQMLKVPIAGLDIAIMVNRHDVSSILLAYKILDACLPELDPIEEVSKRPFATGIFRSPATGRVIQLFAQEDRQVVSIDGTDIGVVSDADGVLSPMPAGSCVRQSVTLAGDAERPTSIQLRHFGNLDELVAVPPISGADAGAIAGRYRSDTTGTEVILSADGPRLNAVGRFGSAAYRLESLAAGIWRAKSMGPMPFGGILSFDDDHGSFRFCNGCTWGLVFRRNG